MNKKTFKPNKRQAFSLIELSIVLIIIGLLIAGVTGGASLIKNAELRKITEEARGYQTAVNSFYAKYNALPGDYNVAIGTMTGDIVTNHTSDNLIQYYAAVTTYANTGRSENYGAWQQLKNDNFIPDILTTVASVDSSGGTGSGAVVAASPGVNIPASKSKGGGWVFDNIGSQNVVVLSSGVPAISTGASAAISVTSLIVGGSSSSTTGNSQLLPTDALSIDSKVDNGVADTGKVTSITQATDNNCASGGTYTTANTYKACSLAFQVDPNS